MTEHRPTRPANSTDSWTLRRIVLAILAVVSTAAMLIGLCVDWPSFLRNSGLAKEVPTTIKADILKDGLKQLEENELKGK